MTKLRILAIATRDVRLTPSQVRVLGFLACRQDGGEGCSPSYGSIQAALGLSEATVLKAIKRLESLGYLWVSRQTNRRNCYTVATVAEFSAGRVA